MYFLLSLYIANRVVSEEIYTAGINFTLPPAVTALTNFTSVVITIIIIEIISSSMWPHASFFFLVSVKTVRSCFCKAVSDCWVDE